MEDGERLVGELHVPPSVSFGTEMPLLTKAGVIIPG